MWNRRSDGSWIDAYDEYKYVTGRRCSLIGGLTVTAVLVIISLIRGNDLKKVVILAAVCLSITALLWIGFTLPLVLVWFCGKLARLVKKVFRIKDA